MHLDVVDLLDFYRLPLGRIVREVVRSKILDVWPNATGDRLCGIGYPTPYLRPYLDEAERVIAMMPAPQGVAPWPRKEPNKVALVLEDMFALPDSSVDKALLVHSLEMAHNPRDVLREVWRILTPGGRILVVVPNRSGLWARMDSTPFGYGRPFSRGQMAGLLRDVMFAPVAWRQALMMPPVLKRPRNATAKAWERLGARVWPAFSGIIMVEAEKQLYQGVTAETAASRRLNPLFAPQGALSARKTLSPKSAEPLPTASCDQR
ncbi:MAG: class I SAM-dependent methyltransferase [Pseudomonadota bacterium]